jgi:hypothetical protein
MSTAGVFMKVPASGVPSMTRLRNSSTDMAADPSPVMRSLRAGHCRPATGKAMARAPWGKAALTQAGRRGRAAWWPVRSRAARLRATCRSNRPGSVGAGGRSGDPAGPALSARGRRRASTDRSGAVAARGGMVTRRIRSSGGAGAPGIAAGPAVAEAIRGRAAAHLTQPPAQHGRPPAFPAARLPDRRVEGDQVAGGQRLHLSQAARGAQKTASRRNRASAIAASSACARPRASPPARGPTARGGGSRGCGAVQAPPALSRAVLAQVELCRQPVVGLSGSRRLN